MKRRVIVTRRLPLVVEASLQREFDAVLNVDDAPMTLDALRDAMHAADALVPSVSDRLPAEVFATPARRAVMIANFGVGTDHIDLEAARSAGVVVTNTPGVLTEDTADLTIALMLAVARRMGDGERELRAGVWTGWRPTHMLGTRVSGKALGIIGYGRIGRAVARRARHGLGMRVLAINRTPFEPDGVAEQAASLDALLGAADFVSLHCPSTDDTRRLIDADGLGRMKPSAFLINTARGDIVDEGALVEALRRGVIAGAALDVYQNEPAVHGDLLTMPNVVLLPHLGSATLESRTAMGMLVLDNLRAFFAGNPPPHRVA